MRPDTEERFEKIELRLSEHDKKTIAHDRRLTAIANLLKTGIRMQVDMESKFVDLETKMGALAEAQKRTEESLRRFLDRSGNGRES